MSEHAAAVIPVTDLKASEVVRACHGSRHSYAPIITPLAPTSAPLDVVAGFLTIHWVDAGLRDAGEAWSWLARHKRAHLVLGSETLDGPAVLEELATDDPIVYRSTIAATVFSGQKGFAMRRICGPRA